jgi:hypothetical protein
VTHGLPSERSGQGVVTLKSGEWDGYRILMGGLDGSSNASTGDVYACLPKSHMWSLVNSHAFPPRYGFGAVFGYDLNVWVIGGTNDTHDFSEVWIADEKAANEPGLWHRLYVGGWV